MFVSASQNTTLEKPLWRWHCISPAACSASNLRCWPPPIHLSISVVAPQCEILTSLSWESSKIGKKAEMASCPFQDRPGTEREPSEEVIFIQRYVSGRQKPQRKNGGRWSSTNHIGLQLFLRRKVRRGEGFRRAWKKIVLKPPHPRPSSGLQKWRQSKCQVRFVWSIN